MTHFLDPLLGGVKSVAGDLGAVPARGTVLFTGAGVTVSDDEPNGQTIVDIPGGGGGGGGTPSNVAPQAVGLTPAAGVATAYSRGDHAHTVTAATLQAVTAGASANWNFNGKEIQSLGAPTASSSAARKFDVDAAILENRMHPTVRACGFTGNITLSGLPSSSFTDGVTLVNDDTVCLVTQANKIENGPWIVNSGGAWARPAHWANGRVLDGDCMFIREGTELRNQGLNVITDGAPIVGTNIVDFDLFTQQPVKMEGDISGYNYATRVEIVSGDSALQDVRVRAESVSFAEAGGAIKNKLYRKESVTYSTTPLTAAVTHNFSWGVGSLTAVVQVNMMNLAGTAESYWLSETRTYGGAVPPVLVGTQESKYQPVAPTGTVALVWGLTSLSVSVTAPSASSARWAINLQVFEVASP